ncbi:MAG: hypothetical protein V1798_11910 [Pseudomonadota bacterium]
MPTTNSTSDELPSQSAEDLAIVEGIKGIVLALDRALRSQRLYAATHPILVRHRQELQTLFTSHLERFGAVSIRVEPYRLMLGATPVYENENQQDSFAFRLFNDGIRTLGFRPGLTETELFEFLEAVTAAATTASTADDSDSVTRFWEKEFEHIHYSVADSIVEDTSGDERTAQNRVEEILDSGMSGYQPRAQGGGGQPAYEGADSDELKIALNVKGVGQMFSDRVVLADDELKAIREDMAESERPERLALDFVDMLLAVLQQEQDKTEFEKVLGALGILLDQNLTKGELHIVALIMEQAHEFPSRPIELAKRDPQFLSWALKILWPGPRTSLLCHSLSQPHRGGPSDVEKLFGMLDPGLVPTLLNLIPEVTDPLLRRAAARGVATLHKGDVGLFSRMLSSKHPQVVETAIEIVAHLKNEKVVDLLAPFIARNEGPCRKEAIEVLKNYPNPRSFKLLYGLLEDPSEEIRLLALKILSGATDKEIARQVLAFLNRPDFKQKSFAERKAFIACVARVAKDDFLPHLESLLNTRVWFRKPEIDEQCRLAAYGLEVVATPKALQVLQAGAKAKNKVVRLLCESALRHLQR